MRKTLDRRDAELFAIAASQRPQKQFTLQSSYSIPWRASLNSGGGLNQAL